MMYPSPKHADAGEHLVFILQKADFFPSLILEVVVYLGGDAKMTRYMQVIVRSLKVFNPSFAGDADFGVAKSAGSRIRRLRNDAVVTGSR